MNQDGQLIIKPKNVNIKNIKKTASGIGWNKKEKYLFPEIPKEWDCIQWFNHILFIAMNECGILLRIDSETSFENIDEALKVKFVNEWQNFIDTYLWL